MGRTFLNRLNLLGVSQRLYLSNSSVGKVLRRDLIQSLWKNFNNSVTLYSRLTTGFCGRVNVDALVSEQVRLSASRSNLSLSAGCVYTIDLHQEKISWHCYKI